MRAARVFACAILTAAMIAMVAVYGLNAPASHVNAGGRMDNGLTSGSTAWSGDTPE
jgi:hypothetical protein